MDSRNPDESPRPLRLLLVEDNELVARSVLRMLRELHYAPMVAGTTHDAREALARGEVDLVLVDRGLPDGDGLSLAWEIRDQYGLPVAVVTGGEIPTDVLCLPKPFRAEQLMALLEGMSASVRARQG